MSRPEGNDWHTKPDLAAECLDCGVKWYAANAWGVAARHARSHDHETRVEVGRVYVYNDKGRHH